MGLFEKGNDECEQGRGLDGGAVGGVKEVQKKLSGVSGEHCEIDRNHARSCRSLEQKASEKAGALRGCLGAGQVLR